MTAKVTYLGHLRTEAVHQRSGTTIQTDAPVDNHGLGEAFSPTDLVATSLASCALTIMGIAADNHNIDISGATAQANKTMAKSPRRISKVEVIITMPERRYTDRQKQVLKRAATSCPVAQSLHPDLEQVIRLVYCD